MTNTASITFRAPDAVAEKLSGEAARTGKPVSAILREAVDAWLGLTETSSLHEQASLGRADAFAALAAQHYGNTISGHELSVLGLTRAVVYARLAVIRRGIREDWINLLFLLDQQAAALQAAGHIDAADVAHGEAVALAECAGEQGDEELGQMVVAAGDGLSPGALNIARDLRSTLQGVG